MITIQNRNVNGNYAESIDKIREIGIAEPSRNGPVFVAPYPVVTVTDNPRERVLFDPSRNANPFFHFFECLWMMYGSNDATWLDTFVSDFSSRYAEEDGHMHGAYGYRWMEHFGRDQFSECVDQLRMDHKDRRVVLSMWDPVADLGSPARDVPCNTHIYPRIVQGKYAEFLDITVCCRSNDIIWGATGANAVHFSFLQEVMAAQLGVRVGKMYQLSNNWHAYSNILEKMGEPTAFDPYFVGTVDPYLIVEDPDVWFLDLDRFMGGNHDAEFTNSFFSAVAVPMWRSHSCYKSKDLRKLDETIETIQASDWRKAVRDWTGRRLLK